MINRRQANRAVLASLGAGVVAAPVLAQVANTAAKQQAAKPAAAKAPAVAPAPAVSVPRGVIAVQDGVDYLTISPKAPTEAPAGKIEVVEFFWYKCPHCFHFEPQLSAWVKNLPKNVAFRRVPVRFRPEFEAQQRLYYALESMGLLESIHPKVFFAIHGQKVALDTEAQIYEWIAKQGVDIAKFKSAYNSFSVISKANRAAKLQDAYQIDGVPTLGVNGKYLSNGTLAKSMDRLLLIGNSLLAKEGVK